MIGPGLGQDWARCEGEQKTEGRFWYRADHTEVLKDRRGYTGVPHGFF